MTKDQKDALIQTIERDEGHRSLITTISEAEDWEYKIQCFGKQLQEKSEIGEERAKVMEWGMRWAVEERKRRRDEEQGQTMRQEQDKKDKQLHFGEEEPFGGAERTYEPKVMSRLEEVRTGRGGACLILGKDEKCLTNETCRKGEGKGNGGKGEHGCKGGTGNKGTLHVENSVTDEDQENITAMTSEEKEKKHKEDVRKLVEMVQKEEMKLEMMQQEEMEHEEQRGRVAPNMGAGGSHLQATSDPREEETEERKKRAPRPRWADCEDDEGKEEEEQETERERQQETKERKEQEKEKETRPGHKELMSEKPPGLEQWVKSEHEEGDEEQRKAQKAREEEKRAQEAQEEEKRAQEAHEEQGRAQKALVQRRAQEEQERGVKTHEERKKEVKAQEEKEWQTRETEAPKEQGVQERRVEAQGGTKTKEKKQREKGALKKREKE